MEDSVRAYDEVVQDMERKDPPELEGTEPKPVPEIKMALINACKRYITHFGKTGEEVVEIRYKVARIYYTYNHLDKAAPAFNDIVENHPGHDVAEVLRQAACPNRQVGCGGGAHGFSRPGSRPAGAGRTAVPRRRPGRFRPGSSVASGRAR